MYACPRHLLGLLGLREWWSLNVYFPLYNILPLFFLLSEYYHFSLPSAVAFSNLFYILLLICRALENQRIWILESSTVSVSRLRRRAARFLVGHISES